MSTGLPMMNPWEDRALSYEFPEETDHDGSSSMATGQWRQSQDPIFYPGLYSASGLDVMGILFQVMSRPNPKINIGPVDGSVALVICDLNLPDAPIIYASDAFCDLTGYTTNEVVGYNCRFLQTPPARGSKSSKAAKANAKAVQRLGHAVEAREEIQLSIINYKKTGQAFTNTLTIIPLEPDSSGCCYAVGLQVELP